MPTYEYECTACGQHMEVFQRFSEDALTKIVSFASLGIYLGFFMVVVAAFRARLLGWRPSGKYRLGAWGMPVNIAAMLYQIVAMVTLAWPRTPEAPWYDNYIVLLSGAVVVGGGLLYMALHRTYGRSEAPYGDAIPKRDDPARERVGTA